MKRVSFNNFQSLYIGKQVFIIITVLVIAGCTGPQQMAPVDDEVAAQHFGFLRVGETTQQEIVSRLGPPSETYENGLVMTYPYMDNLYQLVVAFTSDHVLERFSLVRRR